MLYPMQPATGRDFFHFVAAYSYVNSEDIVDTLNPKKFELLPQTIWCKLLSLCVFGWVISSGIIITYQQLPVGPNIIALLVVTMTLSWVGQPFTIYEDAKSINASNKKPKYWGLYCILSFIPFYGGLAGFVYLLKRRLITVQKATKDNSNAGSEESDASVTETGIGTKESTNQTTDDRASIFENHLTAAETAIEAAATAETNGNLGDAMEAYSEALNQYQAALDTLDAEATERRTEIESAVESTCGDFETVKTRKEHRSGIIEALQSAERSFQEGIAAHVQDDQTLARIRFRQAKDTFEDAHEAIVEGEIDLLTEPVTVDVQPAREPSSVTPNDLPAIPETAAAELTDVGIETVDHLDSGDEPPWTPAAVEELDGNGTIDGDVTTTLTLLAWWHGNESYTFETVEEIERRQQKAVYGFNQIY